MFGSGLALLSSLRDADGTGRPIDRGLCRRLQGMFHLLQERLQEAEAAERSGHRRLSSIDESFHLLYEALEHALNSSSQ